MKIDGLPAIVTGAASGLGEGAARALAAKGARVALLDINADALEAVAGEIGGLAVACDVTGAEEAGEAVARAHEAHGACAIAVNCAGIAPAAKIVGRDGPMDLDAFRKVIEVNLIGTFNMMRLTAADMARREPNQDGERGVVINTASIAAFEGQVGQAAYAASKGGVVGLTLPAAREFTGAGIRVNAIAPGLFGTPMLLGMPREVQDSLTATIPFPSRFGKPSEYAALAIHMVENPILNGECVRLDSAMRMQAR